LKVQFIKKNRNVHNEISKAIDTGDIELAHRLAHTLKSNAAQLNKTILQHVSEEIEDNLIGGKSLVTPNQMETLEIELNSVIAELEPEVAGLESEAAESAQGEASASLMIVDARNLLEKLEPLLKSSDPECFELTDSLRLIPGSEELVAYMEDFDFESAVEVLYKLLKEY